jgi:hypothetical protein
VRAGAVAFLVMCTSVSALAEPTKIECANADTRAQTLRSAGKLRDARVQLELCSSQACPAIVRQDCTERLDEVMRASPTIIFDVKDATGVDVASTRVTMDGKPLVERLDGKPVSVDPGQHTFTFDAQGHPTATSQVLVHEGDKERRVSVVLQPAPVKRAAVHARVDEQTPPVEPRPEIKHSSGASALAIVIGSVGLVGIGIGAGTGAVAISNWNASQRECGSTSECSDHDKAVSDHNTASDFATVSTTTFIAGGALAAAAVIIFLVSRHHAHERGRVGVQFAPLLGRTTGLAVGGTFP